HVRIGSFQRLMALQEEEHLAALVAYCLEQFPGPPAPEDAPARDEPAIQLMHQVVERMADLAASYMVAGFVHGVLNTDNMNITGESFDYGPWRWLPKWDPSFTAAYFDHGGLYAFGRQPEALNWNCGQLAVSLRPLAESEPLIAALERFGPLYMQAIARRWCWRLGVKPRGTEADSAMVSGCEKVMRERGWGPDRFFYFLRGGPELWQGDPEDEIVDILSGYEPVDAPQNEHSYWNEDAPQSMLIEEVEAIWSAIDERDDWAPLHAKVEALRRTGEAHGPAPQAQGHTAN
ncbi:MAG: protein adenylyltransferase SelO family protein, partial [Pseudomonadota bacterium]